MDDDDTSTNFIKTENGVHQEKLEDENNIKSDATIGQSESVKIWKRIPCFGLILIVVKNIIGGASDVVVKKIAGIGSNV